VFRSHKRQTLAAVKTAAADAFILRTVFHAPMHLLSFSVLLFSFCCTVYPFLLQKQATVGTIKKKFVVPKAQDWRNIPHGRSNMGNVQRRNAA
jgi:hypothetical protein